MTIPDQNQAPAANGEQLFLRKALANAERAARFSRIKNIVVTVIALPVLFYLAGSAPEHKLPFTVVPVGVMLVVITSKLTAQANSNTRAILQAIAALPQK